MPRAKTLRGTRHLLNRWAEVAARLRAARRVALFLDFDGTLAPIRRRPEEVRLGESTRRLFRWLARNPKVRIWIVSGRRLADVRKRAGVPGVTYIGLHGLEGAGGMSCQKGTRRVVREAKRSAEAHLKGLPGIRVEDKGLTFVVHYREASQEATRQGRALLRETLQPFEPDLRLLRGKKVWEVIPRGAEGKGGAVRIVLRRLGGRHLPIYIGDDTTDESAFAALRAGITVRVGVRRATKARFCLRAPDEVMKFLLRLEAELA